MNRLIFALALAPSLLATLAQAQTAPENAAKELWCSEAFTVLFASEKPTVPADQMDQFNTYVGATAKLMDSASKDYLAAGFTQDQIDKIKADLVLEVTPAVTTGAAGKYGPGDCNPVLALFLPAPPAASAPESSSAPAADASAPSAGPDASSAQ